VRGGADDMMGGFGGMMGGLGGMTALGSLIGLLLVIVLVLAAIWLFQQVTGRPQAGS
jgi:hypothetical protein